MAAVLITGRLTATALLGACLALGGCSSVSGLVSDTWPTWAGGEPKDVPPRPGAPGYAEFIAHQERQDAAAGATTPAGAPAQAGASASAAPGTTAAVPTTATATAAPAVNPAVSRAAPQQFPPASARPDDRATTQGGLY